MTFWLCEKNGSIRKIQSKFLTSQPVNLQLQYTLTNISRSKGNQAMKFGQLIEYDMKNIFLEKLYTKCEEKIVPDPFLEGQN